MRRRGRRGSLFGAVAAVLTTSCGAEGGTSDKAGGTGDPVVLRMATINGDLAFTPQVRYLVDRVEEVSEGNLRIEMVYEVGGFEPTPSSRSSGRRRGRYDLGVVGTQVFDTLGVTSFRALTAPMLVDSYPCRPRSSRAAHGSDDAGAHRGRRHWRRRVGGRTAEAGGRGGAAGRPAGLAGSHLQHLPLRRSVRGDPGARRIPVAVLGDARDQALREGSLDGFESSLLAYRLNAQEETAPYLTTNVTLWPQTLAAVANPDLDGRLTDEQRDWLRQAADEAAGRSSALADTDAQSLEDICAAGARLTEASEAELAALQKAFASVYADFRRDPETGEFLERSRP